jgi:hypothetical protein
MASVADPTTLSNLGGNHENTARAIRGDVSTVISAIAVKAYAKLSGQNTNGAHLENAILRPKSANATTTVRMEDSKNPVTDGQTECAAESPNRPKDPASSYPEDKGSS